MNFKNVFALALLPLLMSCSQPNQNSDAKLQPSVTPSAKVALTATVSQPSTTTQTGESLPVSSVETSGEALLAAIQDEYKAFTLYSKVITAFGDTNPFANIRQSEQTHIDLLKPLLTKYAIAIPENTWGDKISAPASRTEACALGVQAEIDNAAMYDKLLTVVKEQDIRDAFTFLRDASENNHLSAFEQCSNGGGNSMGTGNGQGTGYKGGR